MEITQTISMEEIVSHAAETDETLSIVLHRMIAIKQGERQGVFNSNQAKGGIDAQLIMLEACLNKSANAVITQKQQAQSCLTITH